MHSEARRDTLRVTLAKVQPHEVRVLLAHGASRPVHLPVMFLAAMATRATFAAPVFYHDGREDHEDEDRVPASLAPTSA